MMAPLSWLSRRKTRLLLIPALGLSFFFAMVALPIGAAGCTSDDLGYATVPVGGTVRDSLGAPIQGATVRSVWSGGSASGTSNAVGAYTVLTRSDCPATITASHDRFVSPAPSQLANPVTDATQPVNLVMRFRVTPSVSPRGFNTAPRALTFTTDTTAVATVDVIVQLDSGAAIRMTKDTLAQMPAGWTRWSATWNVSSGTAEGAYTFMSCVLNASSTSNCTQASNLLSEVASAQYFMDVSAPTLGTTTPSRFADVLAAPTVSATWTDTLSGIDSSSLTMKIDGETVPVSRNASTVSASGAALAPGIHVVSLDGRDIAGNLATSSFIFTIYTLAATPASATLRSQTVDVGNASSVTFPAPAVDIPAFSMSFNASTQVGYGTFNRQLSFGEAQVVFTKPGSSVTVQVTVPTVQTAHKMAILGPSNQPLTANIDASAIMLPGITAGVPNGYSGAGASATLQSVTSSLGEPHAAIEDPLDPFPDGSYPVDLGTQMCATTAASCSPAGASWTAVVNLGMGNRGVAVGVPASIAQGTPAVVRGPQDPDTRFARRDPGCGTPNPQAEPCGQQPDPTTPDGFPFPCPADTPGFQTYAECGQSNYMQPSRDPRNPAESSLGFGCGERPQGINLCSGLPDPVSLSGDYVGFFQNLFAYSFLGCRLTSVDQCAPDATPDQFAVWQQVHVAPNQSGSCPTGRSGTVSAKIRRIDTGFVPTSTHVATAVAHPMAFANGVPSASGPEWVTALGSVTTGEKAPGANLRYQIAHALAYPVGPFVLDARPTLADITVFQSRLGFLTDRSGNEVEAPRAAGSWWPSSGFDESGNAVPRMGSANHDLELFSGANFTSPTVGAPSVIATASSHLTLTFACT